ncbi:MAG: ABC transporter substrate-binding protein [Geminicoccaceae bacterium]
MRATVPILLTTLLCLLISMSAIAEPRPGGTLIIATASSPRHLNPAVQSGTPVGIPGSQVFAAPLRFDADWNPEPYLAESWEWSKDGLSLTLKLVEGATFHDGHPITSEDVAFSIKTIKANHPFKTMFGVVETVETPDERTAVLKLSQPHPALLLALSSQLGVIIPKHIYDDGQDMASHPRNSQDIVGSGPFKVTEFKPGEYVILERYEDYFIENRPYLDKIVVQVIPEASSHVIALENEEAHMAPTTSISLRDTARLNELDHLVSTTKGYEAIGPLNWLAFNTEHDKLKDQRVRQAICYAIDRNFINDVLHVKQSIPATGPVVPGSPFYAETANRYDLDLEKSKALLAEAGAGDGLELTIDYFPGYEEQQKLVAEYLRAQLKKVGITLTVRASADFPGWAERVSNWEFEMTMDNVYNWGDPVIGVHRTYLCDNHKKGVIWSNTQRYCNPKVDGLLAEAGVTLDQEQRRALYVEAQEIIVDEAPICYVNVDPLRTVYHAGLGNPPLEIWGASAPLDNVYWETPPATANMP